MYGLIGEKLGHSYSKTIHEKLADYEYDLFPLSKEEFIEFMNKKEFTAINVTIPYKEAVMPYLDIIEPSAQNIGAVNTIYKSNGKFIGTNTDYYGFKYLLENNNIHVKDKKCLILGNGGASKAVKAVINDLGAKEILIVSVLNEPNTIDYNTAYDSHKDCEVIINTSPIGMYPKVDDTPIDLSKFNQLEAVVDVVYNPIETKLYKDAKELGAQAVTGLEMLVAQAKAAVEIFTEKTIDSKEIDKIYHEILEEMK